MNKTLRLLCLLAIPVFVTACGWQLRGTESLDNVAAVHISAHSSEALFADILAREIEARGTAVTDSTAGASHDIIVLGLSEERRTASVGGRGEAAEYLLAMSLRFVVLDRDGQPLAKPQTVEVQRVYDHDETRALSKYGEEETLRSEMMRDLAYTIIRFIDTLD